MCVHERHIQLTPFYGSFPSASADILVHKKKQKKQNESSSKEGGLLEGYKRGCGWFPRLHLLVGIWFPKYALLFLDVHDKVHSSFQSFFFVLLSGWLASYVVSLGALSTTILSFPPKVCKCA